MPLLDTFLQDLRFSVRMFRKNPGFAIIAGATIALGIASTTAVFTVVHSVLLRQLPFRQPDRLIALAEKDISLPRLDRISYLSARAYVERGNALEGVVLYNDGGSGRYFENGASERLRGQRVSPEFFRLLGVQPMLGRTFVVEDAQPSRNNVIILSYALWKRLFGADPHIIGRVLPISNRPIRVIGVMPPDFRPFHMSNPGEVPQVFRPITAGTLQSHDLRDGATAVARLKPGVTLAAARAELTRIRRELAREHGVDPQTAEVTVTPLHDKLTGRIDTALWTLTCAVVFVLLIACANVTNLLLTRASGRATETAVRAALGCGRWRMARQLVTESLLLTTIGGAAGVLLAWFGIRALVIAAPSEIPRIAEVRMDTAVLATALAATVLTGTLFGLAPALWGWRLNLQETLRAGRDLGGSRRARGIRNALVIAQIACAFVLAIGAGLLGRSLHQLLNVKAGYDPHHILTMTVFTTDFYTSETRLHYYQQLVDRVRTLPGVEDAAMISGVPLSSPVQTSLIVEGRSVPGSGQAPVVDLAFASPGYFHLMRIPLVSGRAFTDRDGSQAPPVGIISRSCARLLFPGQDPIGRRIQMEDRAGVWLNIVGVVGDVWQHGMDDGPSAGIYVPQAQWPDFWYRLMVRTPGNPWSIYPAVRDVIHELNPREPMFHVQPMDDYVTKSLADRIFALSLIGSLGLLALALAGVGIYGVISYAVAQRTREVGIRMALGASRWGVITLVMKDLLLMLALGLTIGFAVALGLTRFLGDLLYNVQPTDTPAALLGVLLLLAIALAGAYFPCRRATSIDAATALRQD